MKRFIALLIGIVFCLTACSTTAPTEFDENADFNTIIKQAKGQTVSFYGWGGNNELNNWLDTTLAPKVKEKYGITLKRVPMDIDQILSKLAGEKQAGTTNGSIDMIWINGENFYSTKENDLLFGPVTNYLPNYAKYVDGTADSAKFDFGYPIDGYESPYNKAQMVLINDPAVTPEQPKNTAELLEFAKTYKGKVTYPALPDFTGSAFVRNIICDIVDYKKFFEMEADKATVKAYIQPAIDYMKELNPYLWNEGKTFPSTMAQVDNMYSDGELVFTLSYEPYSVALNIENGTYTQTTQSFIFDKGTIGNTNFIAIAKNSPNKQAALTVINEILSPKMQASKFEKVRLLSAIDYPLLNDDEKALFDSIDIGKGILEIGELSSKQIPEIPAKFVPIIEEIWLEEVVGK